jgi:hypothetical protein
MTLEQLSQIGEFLGGLSVLLTLVYLAVQIRGNTRAVRSAGAQQTHDSMIQLYRQLAGDAELNRIFRVGTLDIDSLTEGETGVFVAEWSATLYIIQNWLYQRNSGVLDEELVMTWLAGVSTNFHENGFKTYWYGRKFMYSKVMQEWVDDMISRPPAHSGYAMMSLEKNPSASHN